MTAKEPFPGPRILAHLFLSGAEPVRKVTARAAAAEARRQRIFFLPTPRSSPGRVASSPNSPTALEISLTAQGTSGTAPEISDTALTTARTQLAAPLTAVAVALTAFEIPCADFAT
jgi:hypothetical protein